MKKIMILTIAGTIAVFTATSTFADNLIVSTANMNHAPTVSAIQDDQMSGMKTKKTGGKSMKKMNSKKRTVKKKSRTKKQMNMKKMPMKKKTDMGDMKMKDME